MPTVDIAWVEDPPESNTGWAFLRSPNHAPLDTSITAKLGKHGTYRGTFKPDWAGIGPAWRVAYPAPAGQLATELRSEGWTIEFERLAALPAEDRPSTPRRVPAGYCPGCEKERLSTETVCRSCGSSEAPTPPDKESNRQASARWAPRLRARNLHARGEPIPPEVLRRVWPEDRAADGLPEPPPGPDERP